MAENIAHRPRVLKSKGGYQGGKAASEMGPPSRIPSGTVAPQPERKKRAK